MITQNEVDTVNSFLQTVDDIKEGRDVYVTSQEVEQEGRNAVVILQNTIEEVFNAYEIVPHENPPTPHDSAFKAYVKAYLKLYSLGG